MNIGDFAVKVKHEIQNMLGNEYVVEITESRKMNGVKRWAVTIHKDKNIAPTIYLEPFFSEYINGNGFETIVSNIITLYKDSAPAENIDMSDFMKFELIKDKICFKLCNSEKNAEMLKEIPSVSFYDLSIIFYVLVNNDMFGSGQILIRNEHLKLWNAGVTELMTCARRNTPKLLNIKFSNIIDVMKNIIKRNNLNEELKDFPDLDNYSEDCFMWVLSNKEGCNGAASILYPNVFEDIYEVVGRSFFVIPSSVHELIVVPDDSGKEYDYWNYRCEQLKNMIRQVNDTEVPEADILSDNLYYYDADEKVFKLVAV